MGGGDEATCNDGSIFGCHITRSGIKVRDVLVVVGKGYYGDKAYGRSRDKEDIFKSQLMVRANGQYDRPNPNGGDAGTLKSFDRTGGDGTK